MKAIRLITVFTLLAALLSIPSLAVSNNVNDTEVIYYEDGSYTAIYTTVIATRSASTRHASRTAVHTDLWGNEVWRVTLNATFTYDGITSVCTLSGVTIGVTDSSWYIISRESHEADSTAYGTVVMGYKVLGITTDKKTVDISITCDKDGNIS